MHTLETLQKAIEAHPKRLAEALEKSSAATRKIHSLREEKYTLDEGKRKEENIAKLQEYRERYTTLLVEIKDAEEEEDRCDNEEAVAREEIHVYSLLTQILTHKASEHTHSRHS